MHAFYDRMPHEQAENVEALSRLLHTLRQNRQSLLQQHQLDDPEALLAGIRDGRIDAHPGYSHYLALRTLADTHTVVRAELHSLLAQINQQALPENDRELPIIWPLALAEAIEESCGELLETAPDIRQDALLLAIDGGIQLEIRMATPEAYCFTWTWGDALLRVDTAPYADSTAPQFHRADGSRHPSPMATADTPAQQLITLVRTIATNPLLENTP